MNKLPVGVALVFGLLGGPVIGQVAQVRHAPTLNGTVEGSVQQMLGETVTINGGAVVTKDLLVMGSPSVRLNGNPIYFGTLDGAGSGEPQNYQVTLNGSVSLRHVVRRTDVQALPSVTPPPAPTSSVDLTLNSPGQSINWSTVRNLTAGGNSGQIAVPAGVYGTFIASGGAGFTLGTSSATQPAGYQFQELRFSGTSQLQVLGPVIVIVANGVTAGNGLGMAADPSSLRLEISAGGLTLTGGASFYGYVTAPSGSVIINGNSQLVGGVVADRLTVAGNGLLRLVAEQSNNLPPSVTLTAPANGVSFPAPAAFTLVAQASDADGAIARVEFYQGTAKLGEDLVAPYTWSLANLPGGNYTYKARAIDNLGAATDSDAIGVMVTSPNQLPVVALTSPADGALFTAPTTIGLTATANDPDGTITKVEFNQGTTKLGEDFTAPYTITTGVLTPGTYQFSARAYDNLNASAASVAVTATVVAPNQSPSITLTNPADGAYLTAPASFTLSTNASDPDGTIAKVEFYQNTTKLGEDLTAPYQFAVSNLGAGTYHFLARATDDVGSSTDSASITVVVTSPNQPPSIVLTGPADGSIFTEPASVNLSATAFDTDGSVAKVEFFQGTTKIGESLSAPFIAAWSPVSEGSYILTAKATDNLGAAATSASIAITVQSEPPTLPFIANFEPSEGYHHGGLSGQKGWTASGGVTVIASDRPPSAQELAIAPSQPVGQFGHDLVATGVSPVFVDYFAKPVAGATPAAAVVFTTSATRVVLVGVTPEATVQVYDGLGGSWRTTGEKIPVGASGRPADWIRLTVREDYATRKWDLYLNGRMLMADIGFTNHATTELSRFSVSGHATTGSSFDDFYAGPENPIAADADHDGMDDAWEIAHGLNPTLNDRNGDPDADGLTSIQEYILGTDPNSADTDKDGIPDKAEAQAGLDPLHNDALLDFDHDGVSNLEEYLQGRSMTKGAVPDTTGAVNLRVYQPGR